LKDKVSPSYAHFKISIFSNTLKSHKNSESHR